MNTAEKLTAIAENQEKVYDKGRSDEWSDFWDVFQNYGNRRNYAYAFYAYNNGVSWTEENFKPKYDLIFKGAECREAFRMMPFTNFKELLEKRGITLNTSGCYSLVMLFQSCSKLTHVPEIDASSCWDNGHANTMFGYCSSLHTVDKLIVRNDGKLLLTEMFYACYALKNIRFGGLIGRSLSFAQSPLSVESMKDTIEHLADYSTENTGVYTLTLKDECKTALEAEGATSPNGNLWTEYVSDLGWVLA